MFENIDLEIEYTVDEYARAIKFIQSRNFVYRYDYTLSPLIVAASALIGLFLLGRPTVESAIIIIPIGIILGLIITFVGRIISQLFTKWSISKQFKSSPALRESKIISFDEEGFSARSSLGEGLTKWEAFIEATESKDDFFFFISNKFAQFVPKRCFASAGEQDRLRQLVKRHLGDKAKF